VLRPSQGDVLVKTGNHDHLQLKLPELCRGIHEIFFGPHAVVKGFKASVQERLPQLQRQAVMSRERGQSSSTSFSDSSSCSDGNTPVYRSRRTSSSGLSSLAPVPSGNELSNLAVELQRRACQSGTTGVSPCGTPVRRGALKSCGTPPTSNRTLASPKSWKAKSGRVHGDDSYHFGDLTRGLIRRSLRRDDSSSAPDSANASETSWPGALTTDEGADWASECSVLRLEAAEIEDLHIQGELLKFHSSMIRGSLAPRWTPRYFELKGGMLMYRKRAGGSARGVIRLDGAHVVAEAPKLSHMGEFFAFRIVCNGETTCRLSSSCMDTAATWVCGVVATCAFFRERSFLGETDVELTVAVPPAGPVAAAAGRDANEALVQSPDAKAAPLESRVSALKAVAIPAKAAPMQSPGYGTVAPATTFSEAKFRRPWAVILLAHMPPAWLSAARHTLSTTQQAWSTWLRDTTSTAQRASPPWLSDTLSAVQTALPAWLLNKGPQALVALIAVAVALAARLRRRRLQAVTLVPSRG